MDEFHFLRPGWLIAIPLSLLLAWGLSRSGFSRSAWERLCDAPLLRELVVGVRSRADWIPLAGVALGWILACLALAGPVWEQRPQPVFSSPHSRVILFDLSRSMDSTDLAPSRLVRARYKLSDLVSAAGDREQALVVFAGDAFVVSPLTDDSATLTNLIPSLATDTVPVQGSRVDRGLHAAMDLLENAGVRSGDIILITDGIDPAYRLEAEAAAKDIAASGHRLTVLGVGTAQGSPVPLADGGFLVDGSGNIVIPRIDPVGLERLASLGGGVYLAMGSDGSDIDTLNRLPLMDGGGSVPQLAAGELTRWVDRGVLLLIPLLVLGALAFRRGWLLLLLIALPVVPTPARALDWASLWSRPDQRAADAMVAEDYASVPENADRRWRAAAAYRRGEYDAAVELGAESVSATDHYNLGNALARRGDLEKAASAYREALARAPDMADARHNLDLVEELMRQQEQQQNQQGDQGEQQEQGGQGEQQSGGGYSGQEQAASDPSGNPGDPGSDQQDSADTSAQNQSAASDGDQGSERDPGSQTEQEAKTDENADSSESPVEQAGDGGTEESSTAADDSAEEAAGEASPSALANLSRVEQEQAMQQWLNRVPDDPGGLLKRKFHYQYGRRPEKGGGVQQW